MAVFTNTTPNKTFVFSKKYALLPGVGTTLTIPDAEYTNDSSLRYNINRMTAVPSEITVTTPPPGYPDTTTDPPAETRPRLRSAFQVKSGRSAVIRRS